MDRQWDRPSSTPYEVRAAACGRSISTYEEVLGLPYLCEIQRIRKSELTAETVEELLIWHSPINPHTVVHSLYARAQCA